MIFNCQGKFPSKACIIILQRLPPRLSLSGKRVEGRPHYPLSLEGYDWSKGQVTGEFLGYPKKKDLAETFENFRSFDDRALGDEVHTPNFVAPGLSTPDSAKYFTVVSPNFLKESALTSPRRSGSMICSSCLFYCKFIAQSAKLTCSLGRDRSRVGLAQRTSHKMFTIGRRRRKVKLLKNC
ncbi:hypothetical protein KY284_020193 [Solanum tuberosum]|nr:hypothetical protein KY284_020193 [Solanum tuberosum]